MKDEGWKMNDESWKMKVERWRKNVARWRIKVEGGFEDGWTDGYLPFQKKFIDRSKLE